MITLSVSGRRCTATGIESLPTGNVDSVRVQVQIPSTEALWIGTKRVVIFAAKTPNKRWIVCPGVLNGSGETAIPGDVLHIANAEIYSGVRGIYADNREITTNLAKIGVTEQGAGGEIVDAFIQNAEDEIGLSVLESILADAHFHENLTVLESLSESPDDGLKYGDRTIALVPQDDVQLLESATYDRVYFVSDLEAVPWMVLGSNAEVVIQDANGTQSIQLSESNDSVTGLPVRMLTVIDGEDSCSYCSRASGADATYTPAGWLDENGDACAAPALSGFTPTTMLFRSETYALSNIAAWPREAYLSLWTLSQMVHTSANRVDHPYVPEDAVLRFTGEIVPNRKYAFSTETDFTLNLNEIEWTGEDAQFVLYLYATGYYDVDITFDGEKLTQDSTFDGDPLFIGGVPEIKTGAHKLIGYWDEQARRWAVGCLDAEEES